MKDRIDRIAALVLGVALILGVCWFCAAMMGGQ